ncbi:hypothetical protein J6A32_07485 [Methanocorpusculum sp.]|nr:hypothetical protein [Methanocorpusculum sp.]MBO5431470.1 hypothetical protein [Methanocorpusculum sp.]MBP3443245.1 hypothetical protein [Methanocorpusculaceae archaeon]
MAKTALYSISVRLPRETIQKLEKYQNEHNKSRSECLQQAVERFVNPENPETTLIKKAIREAFNDPEIQTIIEKISERTVENTTFTIKKQ